MPAILLDGVRLSRERLPSLQQRAAAVRDRRGAMPTLVIVAFGEDGSAPHVRGKLRACADAGVQAMPLVFGSEASTADVADRMLSAVREARADGLFLQFPFPAALDGDVLAAAIPYDADVDVMTPRRIDEYLADATSPPPVTVSAALELLRGYDIDVRARSGVVIAEPSPFARMFSTALGRLGADMQGVVSPGSTAATGMATRAQLLLVAAERPGLFQAADLAADAVVIDAGYYNPGGRGDVSLDGGTAHLHALAPVPGGIGPMTVSCLIERVIEFAEREERDALDS